MAALGVGSLRQHRDHLRRLLCGWLCVDEFLTLLLGTVNSDLYLVWLKVGIDFGESFAQPSDPIGDRLPKMRVVVRYNPSIARLRNFAPFNAMLLQVQKPGLTYAASAYDWAERFGRNVKEDARPLLILWPFGPVALVYDVMDTEGDDSPETVSCFPAFGDINYDRIMEVFGAIERKHITVEAIDRGDSWAGSIRLDRRPSDPKQPNKYTLKINDNHPPPIVFSTLAHELGHLYLGHLGPDKRLNIPERAPVDEGQKELEAESVAYLLCARNGIESKSEAYLSNYVSENVTIESVDLYQVMRASGQIERLMNIGGHTKFR